MTTPQPEGGYRAFASFAAWADLSVGDAWGEFLGTLDTARGLADPADLDRALEIALRSAALETGAIEGLYATSRGVTRTVALQGAMWEAELEKLGVDVRGHFDAQLAAFDLVLDAATKSLEITEAWLRALHAKVCAAQQTHTVWTELRWQEHPFARGEYKTSPNNVILADGTTHWYAPVADVSAEIHRLMMQIRTEEFHGAHAVLQTAFTHHALTAVHPFSDGNGRAARALGSVFLYRTVGIPLVIFSDQQERYWDALAGADRGDLQPFATFIEERALDTMAMVTNRLREARSPLDEQATRIRGLFRAHGGLTHAEVQAVGQRLADYIQQTLPQTLQALVLEPDVRASIEPRHGKQECTFWDQPYHTLTSGGAFALRVQSTEPVQVTVETTPFIGIANDTANPFAFVVIDANRSTRTPLRLRVADLHPSISTAAESLIEGWAKGTLARVLDELQRSIGGALDSEGY